VLHRREPSRECLTPILDPGIKLIRTLDEPDELFGVQVDLKTATIHLTNQLRCPTVDFVEVGNMNDSELKSTLKMILQLLETLMGQSGEAALMAHAVRAAETDPVLVHRIRQEYLRLESANKPATDEVLAQIRKMIEKLEMN
jgi:hypothetical protein